MRRPLKGSPGLQAGEEVTDDDGFCITVTDEGKGFDISEQINTAVDGNAKSGRGIALIRKLTRDVTTRDGGRTLVMAF